MLDALSLKGFLQIPVAMVSFSSWPPLLPLLVLVAAPCSTLDSHCPNRSEPQYQLDLTRPSPARLRSSAASLSPLYDFARLFLQAVQPNDFPLDIIYRASRNEIQTAEVMRYEAGYLACLVLSVLYMLMMPTAGCVLVLRSLYRKNATLNDQPLPSSVPWYQRDVVVIACLSVTVVFLLAGVTLTFATNDRIRENTRPTLSYLRSDIDVIDDAVASVPQKVESIIDKFSVFQMELVDELNGTFASRDLFFVIAKHLYWAQTPKEQSSGAGHLIGESILLVLRPQIYSALIDLNFTVQDATGALLHLREVQEITGSMQKEYTVMQMELAKMHEHLRFLQDLCVQDCGILGGAGLETDAAYNMIPSVDEIVDQLSNITGLLPQAEMFTSSISEICANQTALQMQGLLAALNDTRVMFRNYSTRLPSLTFLSKATSSLRTALDKTQADIDYYDYVRWSVSVAFCTLILIIVLLMAAGLTLGASVVIFPTLYPADLQDRLRLTAVNLLHVSAGLTFVFSWLFIIMVFVNLFFGGNVHALYCRSWTNGKIFELLDAHHLVSSSPDSGANATLAPDAAGSDDIPALPYHKRAVSTFEIYQGCETGRSLFYSMHMNKTFNLDEFLNASQYLEQIGQKLQNLSVNVSGISLLPLNARSALERFMGFNKLDGIDFRTLLSRGVVKTDLAEFADALENTANLPENYVIHDALVMEVISARQLVSLVQRQNSSRMRMISSIEALVNISHEYQINAAKTLLSAHEVVTSLQQQFLGTVQNASLCVMERGEELLTQYLRRVQHAILDEVLECSWLPISLSNMYTAACENLIGPWNAFWLCLGWCCAFLVPGVIFSILAASLWQPKSSAVSESFRMPDDIIDKDQSSSYITMDDTPDKRQNTKKINAHMYITLDEVISSNEDSEWKKEKREMKDGSNA